MATGTEDEDPAQRFLPRIRQELDKLRIAERQCASVLPQLLAHARFLDTNGGKQPSGGKLKPDSSYFDFSAKLRAVVEHFRNDGLDLPQYLEAVLKQPQLFLYSADTTASNIQGVMDRFATDGLTRQDYLQAALKQPSLFCQSPDKIASNNDAERRLGRIVNRHNRGARVGA